MKNYLWILVLIITLIILFTFQNKFNEWLGKTKENDEYKAVQLYLLNDSPLYGFNKPKIWIHSKYEINARKWKSFYSRNTTDLNQPYIHLTIQSIINHCDKDFHICLIDDQSFSKLIPSWDIELTNMPEPLKSRVRQEAMLSLIYYYGGIIVPDSFLCIQSLLPLWVQTQKRETPFFGERINKTSNLVKQQGKTKTFLPDTYFLSALKNSPVIKEGIEFLKNDNSNEALSSEKEFLGSFNWWAEELFEEGRILCIEGSKIGVKKMKTGEPILLEDILGENYIDLAKDAFGIYIPSDELLKRTKYQWFSVMSQQEILDSRLIIAKYFLSSAVSASQTDNLIEGIDSYTDRKEK